MFSASLPLILPILRGTISITECNRVEGKNGKTMSSLRLTSQIDLLMFSTVRIEADLPGSREKRYGTAFVYGT